MFSTRTNDAPLTIVVHDTKQKIIILVVFQMVYFFSIIYRRAFLNFELQCENIDIYRGGQVRRKLRRRTGDITAPARILKIHFLFDSIKMVMNNEAKINDIMRALGF